MNRSLALCILIATVCVSTLFVACNALDAPQETTIVEIEAESVAFGHLPADYEEIEPIETEVKDEIALFDISRVPVLAYHSIMSREFYYPLNVNNPYILLDEVFYEQMRYLYENDFTPLTTEQFIDFLFYDALLPKNPIVITFDDGYLDNYLFAAPILREFGFTAMVFLITGAIAEETPTMTAYPAQFMGVAEVLNSTDVFEHGSHSHDMHRAVNGRPPLTFESVANIRADLRQSFEAPLTFTTGFAYPHGRHSRNALRALAEEGVRFAFVTRWGYADRETNPLLLPRFSIHSDWTHETFSEIVWGLWEG